LALVAEHFNLGEEHCFLMIKKEAVKILSGEKTHKLTPEIIQFAKVRFFNIYPYKNKYSYSKEIRNEINDVFELTLTSESLREYFTKWKGEILLIPPSKSDKPNNKRHLACDCSVFDNSCNSANNRSLGDFKENNNRKCDASLIKSTKFVRHAGVLIFSLFLEKIGCAFGVNGGILKQWLTIIFLEIVNIEQSKYLDFNSLNLLLGETIRRPQVQRNMLNELANEDIFNRLFKLNGELCDVVNQSDFYYDPHTKQYTGTQKILKGWCGALGRPDKALHSDFIHSSIGQPLFMVHADNYLDLREKYNSVILKFRKCFDIDKNRCVTMIIDRGIYKIDVLNDIEKDPQLNIITWEKNFKKNDLLWKKNDVSHFSMKRYRNNSKDIRCYKYQFIDIEWSKNPKIRKLVVKATNPVGRTIEVAILATDKIRNPEEIISLIFNRWLQENDFKYLEKHYGINQITSYDTTDYAELAKILEDKEITSGTYKAIAYDKLQVDKKLKMFLLKRHQQEQKNDYAKARLKEVESHINDPKENDIDELKKEQRKLKSQIMRVKNGTVDEDILACDIELQKTKKLLEETEKCESKLNSLIDQGYKSLDTRKKKLMDILKIYARNIFYYAFQDFKFEYDNFRDDHSYFRNLSHADGVISFSTNSVELKLFPTAYLEPKIKKIIETFLANLSNTKIIMPDDSNRPLTITLIANETLELAIV
jgi:hypothetical protein